MRKTTYRKLKKKLYNVLEKITKIEQIDLLIIDLDKKETIFDLTRFMVFIEELEQKSKTENINIDDFKNQLLLIKKYVDELDTLI